MSSETAPQSEIERVARAICLAHTRHIEFSSSWDMADFYRALARAAIEEVRNPIAAVVPGRTLAEEKK